MRYKITLNMPSRRGAVVHQILCEHASRDLHDFMETWSDDGFIIVNELYNQDDGSLKINGEIALTYEIGAKVSYMEGLAED